MKELLNPELYALVWTETVQEFLKDQRSSRNFTINDVEVLTGVSKNTYYGYEAIGKLMPMWFLKILCDAYSLVFTDVVTYLENTAEKKYTVELLKANNPVTIKPCATSAEYSQQCIY